MSLPPAKPKSPGYLPTLDGWRAVAIAAVLLCHDRVYRFGRVSTDWMHRDGGLRGVELFFALSGLLIATRLFEEERLRGRIQLRGFYVRRIFRIQPAAWVFLATLGILSLLGVFQRMAPDLAACLLMVRNFAPKLHASPDGYYDAHFWSLSVEEHFYLLFPAFLLLVRGWRSRAAALLGLGAAIEVWRLIVIAHPHLESWVAIPSTQTDVAAGPIAFAAAAAVLLTRPAVRVWSLRWLRPWAMLLLTLAALCWTTMHVGRTGHFPIVVAFPLLLISTLLHPESVSGRLLETAPMRFLGHISYSLYLWQMLFFPFFADVPRPHSALLVFAQDHLLLRYGITFALAVLSYFLVEKPLVRLGHRLAKPATPGREDLGEAPAAHTAHS